MMEKRRIIIIILAIIAINLTLTLLFASTSTIKIFLSSDCEGKNKDLCLEEKALKQLSTSLCKEISDSLKKSECITRVAIQSKNPNYCNSIDGSAIMKGKNNYNYRYETDLCYLKYAITTKDILVCDRISEESSDRGFTTFKKTCISEITI